VFSWIVEAEEVF
jgi:hypothetical protein